MAALEELRRGLYRGRRKNIVHLLPWKSRMGALNIKDKAVADKARLLARLRGTTITEAVSAALEESLRIAEPQTARAREERERRVDEIVARFQASIPPDAPSYEQIMADMYDEHGLPK